MLDSPPTGPRPGPRETIVLLAGLMALNALAIDIMIPALGEIGARFDLASDNDRQLVVVAYMAGFGATQLIWGPLADRFGRKPVLASGILLYALFAMLCSIAGSFALLIAARFLQGASAAVTRVLVVTVVRDLFDGEAMARIMSLVFMVFMVVPVIAPSLGQLVLLVAPWRAIFLILGVYALVMLLWSWIRLPETLKPEFRRELSVREIAEAARLTVADPMSRGYTLALTATFGILVAYIASIQQIVAIAFASPQAIGWVFASIAAPMALASWGNSRIVGRFGLRRVGHSAALALLLITCGHALAGFLGLESLVLFIVFQALTMVCFAFTSSNLNTLAMENMGRFAGTASSIQGSVGTLGAAVIGFAIGRAFDGNVTPFLVGAAACAAAAFLIIVLTEPDRLFAALAPARRREPGDRASLPLSKP